MTSMFEIVDGLQLLTLAISPLLLLEFPLDVQPDFLHLYAL